MVAVAPDPVAFVMIQRLLHLSGAAASALHSPS